jgi:hypothetical protein
MEEGRERSSCGKTCSGPYILWVKLLKLSVWNSHGTTGMWKRRGQMYPEKKLPVWMVLMIKETFNGRELNSTFVSGASESASI